MSSIEHMIGEECAKAANAGVGGKWIDPAKPLLKQADVARIYPRSPVKLGTIPDRGKVVLNCV